MHSKHFLLLLLAPSYCHASLIVTIYLLLHHVIHTAVMFGTALGQVSSLNQMNGKMIVFVPEQLVHTELTLLYPVTQIRANIKSGLDSQKSGVANHVQILRTRQIIQDRYYKTIHTGFIVQFVTQLPLVTVHLSTAYKLHFEVYH